MWIYICIALIFIYCIYKEHQALGCNSLFDLNDCDNANGKAVRGTVPSTNDSTDTLYKKIVIASTYSDKFVYWRIAYIMSIVIMVLFIFIIDRRAPSETEFVIGILVIMMVAFLVNGFYKFHVADYASKHIFEAIDILKSK